MRSQLILLLMVLLTPACGKKGALIYPDMLVPAAPAAVTVRQVGPSLKLAFNLPDKDMAGQLLTDLIGVKVFRREAILEKDVNCTTCANNFQVFKTIYVDHLDSSTQRYGRLILSLDNDVIVGREYTYKVLAFTQESVEGDPSKPVLAKLVQAALPPVLQAVSAPTEIKLEFIGLLPHEAAMAGYNLYRAVKGEDLPFLPLNKEPLASNIFIDTGLERGRIYVYAVRMVVRSSEGELMESALSNVVEAALNDDE